MYIGIVGGGSSAGETTAQTIGPLCQEIEDLSLTHPTGVDLDLVFHIDGPLVPNEFEGIRTGRFFRSKNILQVQIAAPESFPTFDVARKFVIDSVKQAIEVANQYLGKRESNWSRDSAAGFTDELEKRIPI